MGRWWRSWVSLWEGDEAPQVLAAIRDALAGAHDDRFAQILERPSYQRAVLRTFVALASGPDYDRRNISSPHRQ